MSTTEEAVHALHDTEFVVSRFFFVERIDDATATVCLGSTGARLKIPKALLGVLLRFRNPASLRALAEADPSLARAAGAVANLRSKGFLVTPAEAQLAPTRRPLTDPPVRLFDCPAHRMVPAETAIVVFGVPWDGGDRQASGARAAPLAIRDVSLQILYGVDRFSARPQGWFDADRRHPLLAGVSIGDCGDVFVDHGEPQADFHARFDTALQTVLQHDTLPVLLGGDATACVPLVNRLQARMPLSVLRIGGVAQRDGVAQGERPDAFVDAAGLAARFAAMPQVRAAVFAVRTDSREGGAVDPETIRRRGADAVIAHLPPDVPVYLGIDVSVLRRPGGGSEDDGLDYPEIRDFLHAIGARRKIVGIDLVGLVPSHPAWNALAMVALHVLVAAMSAAKDSHNGTGGQE